MGGGFVAVVVLPAQATADLRLADAAVPQNDQLGSLSRGPTGTEVQQMSTQRAETIVPTTLRQNLRGDIEYATFEQIQRC